MYTKHSSNLRTHPIILLVGIGLLLMYTLAGGRAHAGSQPEIEAAEALGLYGLIDVWVRAWDLPAAESPQALGEPLCAAVVTLRLDGRVFGRGSAASPDPDPMLLWEATSEAINSANSKLTNERDAMWEAFIRELTQRITITVELGDALVPISPSELSLPGFGYSPGSMGFAARLGEECDTIGSEAQLTNRADPARTAGALALTLSNDSGLVMQPPETLSEQGFVFYRWLPTTLTQPAPGLGAVFADRGGRIIESSEISVRSIGVFADQLAMHMRARLWEGVEDYGFVGTLDPITGKAESAFAGPFEQALGAYALLRYGRNGADSSQREAVVAGRDVLRDLGRVEQRETEPWTDPLGACMSLIALSELPLEMVLGDKDLGVLRTRSLETLDGLYSEKDGFDSSLPVFSHGLIAHALSVSAKLDPRDRTGLAASAIGRVFLETEPTQLVGQMPFLAWAQLEHTGDSGEIPTRSVLRQMRELVWDHQLRRADLDWVDRDLAGGIVFTSAKAPLPSWSGLRPLAAIATMLGDERLTPGSAIEGEVPIQIGRLVESVRFVRQLAAEGEIMHMYGEAQAARYGVRMALWDQRMPIESSAMALLMLSETRASFDALRAR